MTNTTIDIDAGVESVPFCSIGASFIDKYLDPQLLNNANADTVVTPVNDGRGFPNGIQEIAKEPRSQSTEHVHISNLHSEQSDSLYSLEEGNPTGGIDMSRSYARSVVMDRHGFKHSAAVHHQERADRVPRGRGSFRVHETVHAGELLLR